VPEPSAVFEDGEETVYKIAKGFLSVGELTFRVAHVGDAGARWLRLESKTEAAAWIAAFVDIGGVTHSYVDATTLLPSSYYWVTSSKDDPLIRTASFDPASGRVFASAMQHKSLKTRVISGQEIHDPVSAMMLARVLRFDAGQEEIRYYVVEGVEMHLMTLRCQDREVLDPGEPCAIATRRISMRTDRLDACGQITCEDPYNSLLLWVAEAPPHPIVKIEGDVGGTTLKLTMKKRTVAPPKFAAAATRPAAP
jgi:hypothetical protein